MATSPLLTYLQLQRRADRDILGVLYSADTRIRRELAALEASSKIGARVRREQLGAAQGAIQTAIAATTEDRVGILAIQALLKRELTAIWATLYGIVSLRRAEAAAEAAETMFPFALLKPMVGADDAEFLLRSARATASRGLNTVEARLSGRSFVPLSQRVYHSRALVIGHVDTVVEDALARGASASELAKDVRAFIKPNTPGGVRYAAMRLGRTELNNAFHASQVKSAIESPWTVGVKWNLSGSHPRPDECNENAESSHFSGGAAGVFKPDDVPGKPHPNCLCYMTSEDLSRDAFIKAFRQGKFDERLAELGASG